MKLDQALKRAGVHIVRQQGGGDRATLILRVDSASFGLWARILEEFLLAAKRPISVEPWKTEVTRVYFVDDTDTVRYLWRIVLEGELAPAAEALNMAVVRATAQSVEVVSSPLYGRVEPDPASFKGAYTLGSGGSSEGHARVAREFAGGGR